MNTSYNPFSPQSLPISRFQFIAPFWGDVDLRGTGRIYYRQTNNPLLLARANNEIQAAFPSSQHVNITNLFVATWDAVGYYSLGTDRVGLLNMQHQ